MRCEHCGTELEQDMRFCPECGSPAPKDGDDLLRLFDALNQQEKEPAEEPAPAADQEIDRTVLRAEPESRNTRTEPVTRLYMPDDPDMDAATRVFAAVAPQDNYDVRQAAVRREVRAQAVAPRPYPQQEMSPRPAQAYHDGYSQSRTAGEVPRPDDLDDGYEDSDPTLNASEALAISKRGNVLRFEWNGHFVYGICVDAWNMVWADVSTMTVRKAPVAEWMAEKPDCTCSVLTWDW